MSEGDTEEVEVAEEDTQDSLMGERYILEFSALQRGARVYEPRLLYISQRVIETTQHNSSITFSPTELSLLFL